MLIGLNALEQSNKTGYAAFILWGSLNIFHLYTVFFYQVIFNFPALYI